MKKLAVIGCVAACVGGVFADDSLKAAQVYDVKVVVKTTAAQKGKLSPSKNPFVTDGSQVVVYRKQASQTWKGVVWGCDCESAIGVWGTPSGNNNVVTGAAIWNTKSPYDIVLLDSMRWHVFNAIDKQGTKCECAWTIGESTDSSGAFLSFAGFGTLKLSTTKEGGNLVLQDCRSYISAINGTVSGWLPAPVVEIAGREAICTFCGIIQEGVAATYEVSEAWDFCPCLTINNGVTAVSGTWTLKYNSALSKKLSDTDSILNVYKSFPASVRSAVELKIASMIAQ